MKTTRRTEFAVLCLDDYGDVIDTRLFRHEKWARAEADWLWGTVDSVPAVVVERIVSRWQGETMIDREAELIYWVGAKPVVAAGGWLPREVEEYEG